MSIIGHYPKYIFEDKHCLVYCGPEHCNCRAGNPTAFALQETRFLIAQKYAQVTCLSCGAKAQSAEQLPCGH